MGAPKRNELQVPFDLVEPRPRFCPSLRTLLKRLTTALQTDLFDIADAITNQPNVGSVITISEQEEAQPHKKKQKVDGEQKSAPDPAAIGVASILNMCQHSNLFDTFLKSPYIRKASDKAKELIRKDRSVGILILSRVSNLPVSVIGKAIKEIPIDLAWSLEASDTDCPPEEKELYRYRYIVIPAFIQMAQGESHPFFETPELQPFYARSKAKIMFGKPGGTPAKPKSCLLVMVISYPKFVEVAQGLDLDTIDYITANDSNTRRTRKSDI